MRGYVALADEQSTRVFMMGLVGGALRMSFNHNELLTCASNSA